MGSIVKAGAAVTSHGGFVIWVSRGTKYDAHSLDVVGLETPLYVGAPCVTRVHVAASAW